MNKFCAVGLAFLLILFSNCSGEGGSNNESETDSMICVLPEPPKLGRMMWLIGDWEYSFEGGRTIETWVDNYTSLSGYSITLMGNDTVSSESISIEEVYPDLFYIPTVIDQNDAQPIRFTMKELTDDYALFENPAHDFPQKIAYKKINADSIVAEISGPMKGSTEQQVIKFPMRRLK